MERRLWPASSIAWTVACLARVGEPVAFPGRRQGLFGRCGLVALFTVTGRFGNQDAQALAVTGDSPLRGFAEVVPQVPPVGNLSRLGCPGRGHFREERSPIPADHLDAGPFGQPLCQAGCLPVRQQVHWPSGLDIDQNRAVDAALARGVLIDADHSRGRCLRLGQRIEQSQDRAAADGHPEDACHPGAGPASERETNRRQRRAQPLGPPAVSPGQPRHLLDKGPPPARSIPAEEPADSQTEDNPSPCAGHIGGKPQVGAVYPARTSPPTRARGPGRRATSLDPYRLVVHVDRQHRHVCDRREQQLLQPEHCFFHGAELSATRAPSLIIFRQLPGGCCARQP